MADEKAPLVPRYTGIWNKALSSEEIAAEHKRIMALIAAREAVGDLEPIHERNGAPTLPKVNRSRGT